MSTPDIVLCVTIVCTAIYIITLHYELHVTKSTLNDVVERYKKMYYTFTEQTNQLKDETNH